MINIYDSKETDFGCNGLKILDKCISCEITEELNGSYELTLEYPILEDSKWQLLIEGNIIKADGQLFRIYHKVKTLKSIIINARHIFYDLLDNFLEDVRPTNLNGAGALDWILTHTAYSHSFTSISDITNTNTAYYVRKSPIEAIISADNSVLKLWGGELVRDNFTIKLLQARGADRGVLVAYGKNIIGIEETLDMDSVCTRLMPTGKDALLLSEKYIDSGYINNYPHPKIRVVEFSDCETEDDLRAAGQNYMGSGVDIPSINYKIDFLELTKTEEYKHYAILETCYLGDTVTVKHSKLNINLKCKVIKITKNILTDRIEKIELGNFKQNISDSFSNITNTVKSVNSKVDSTKSVLQNAIDNATTTINSALGGYVLKRNGEILVMDTEDVNTSTNVLRINKNGIGFSSTGYNGQFTTAWTLDGHFVADFITTGKLLGGAVQFDLNAGTLKISHTDGSYTLLDANGLNRYVTTTAREYHYLSYIGSINWINTRGGIYSTATVQLPDEFKNTKFVVLAVLSNAFPQNYYLALFENKIENISYDYSNGKFSFDYGFMYMDIRDYSIDDCDASWTVSYIAIA